MAYSVTDKCLKCGICIGKCPEQAFIVDEKTEDKDGFVFYAVHIDPEICTECGICVSEEFWCPAQAINNF